MSDYEALEVGLNDLGKYEAEHEVSGYDAVTTTQQGLRQDEFMKDSGLSIDMIGDAKIAQEKEEKEKKQANDLTEAFYRAVRDEQMMKIGDLEISRGDLNSALSNYNKQLKEKAENAKTPEERARYNLELAQSLEMAERFKKGTETEEDMKFVEDAYETNKDFKDQIDAIKKNANEDSSQEVKNDLAAYRAAKLNEPREELSDNFNPLSFDDSFSLEELTGQQVLISQTNKEAANTEAETPEIAPNHMNMNDFSFA
tara:strand:+ start:19778 stop:20545 length:768 start_codon:yes stop_codon:yes gene_type:complete